MLPSLDTLLNKKRHHLLLNLPIASLPFRSVLWQWKHWHIGEVTTTWVQSFSCFGNQHLIFLYGGKNSVGKELKAQTQRFLVQRQPPSLPQAPHSSCQEDYPICRSKYVFLFEVNSIILHVFTLPQSFQLFTQEGPHNSLTLSQARKGKASGQFCPT